MKRLTSISFLSAGNLLLAVFLLVSAGGCKNKPGKNGITDMQNVVAESAHYDEPYRLQYHFSPDSMWMNDPNGLFYLDGVYHLFYQYHPYSTQWGPMHWGHAVSTDLLHWQHLPVALYPDSLGAIFSGTAAVDRFNSAGLATGSEPPVIAAYTIHDSTGLQTQGIAFSNDKGMTWEKYTGNPVLTNPGKKDFRDPRIFWHDESKHWIMVLSVGDHVEFYRSPNLKEWKYASSFGRNDGSHEGTWECPDLFRLRIPGSTVKSKWILMVSVNAGAPNGGSGTQYFIGTFNGTTFVNENYPESTRWIDFGPDNYAGSTWSDIPQFDGRRIFIGWMANWAYADSLPTSHWRGSLTLPRRLRLAETGDGLKVASLPVKEIETLLGEATEIQSSVIAGSGPVNHELADLSQVMIRCSFVPDTGSIPAEFGLQFTSAGGDTLEIGYRTGSGHAYVDRSRCGRNEFSKNFTGLASVPVFPGWEELKFEIYADRSSVECFINDGTRVLSCRIFPRDRLNSLSVFSRDGKVLLREGAIRPVNGIWNTPITETEQ